MYSELNIDTVLQSNCYNYLFVIITSLVCQTNNYSKYITFIDRDCTYCTASKSSNICTSNHKNKKKLYKKMLGME